MRSPNRTHERQSFFKYMPASTAEIVLKNRTLRWSSPSLFNDPFDVPRELSSGIEPEEIVQALARRISTLIEAPPADTSSLAMSIRPIVEAVKLGLPPGLKDRLLATLSEAATRHRPTSESMDALRELWRKLLPEYRILCLTESPDHTAMWYHYGDQYRGAVLEFRCVDEIDSAWLMAKPVSYLKEKPAIYTAEGWAELLTMNNLLAVKTILDTATYTKSPDWSYEGEWRIATYKRPSNVGLFTDYEFNERELAAVYLGPNISPEAREALISASSRYPDIKVLSTSIGMSRGFNFNEVAM